MSVIKLEGAYIKVFAVDFEEIKIRFYNSLQSKFRTKMNSLKILAPNS